MKAGAKIKFRAAAIFFLAAGLAALALGFAYSLLTPAVWQSEARVRIEARGSVRSDTLPSKSSAFSLANEASHMDAERQFIRSDAVLSRVIENLHLQQAWAKQWRSGPFGTNEALGLLRAKTAVRVAPNTSVLEIQASSGSRDETAAIANEIARLYCEHRRAQRDAASRENLGDFQARWDAQNARLAEARAQLEKIVQDISKARAAVADSLYEPEDVEVMQLRREQLETAVFEEQGELEHLKTLKPDELAVVLPTLVTNDVLNADLDHLSEARRALAEARAKSGADAEETKRADALARHAAQRVSDAVAGVIAEREADLAMRKAVLEKLTRQISTANTNVAELSPDNPAYVAALQRVAQLEEERQELRDKMARGDSPEVVSPFTLSAQIVDRAEVPVRPSSPDRRVVLGMSFGGIAGTIAGLVLLWVSACMPAPKRLPAPAPFSKVRQN